MKTGCQSMKRKQQKIASTFVNFSTWRQKLLWMATCLLRPIFTDKLGGCSKQVLLYLFGLQRTILSLNISLNVNNIIFSLKIILEPVECNGNTWSVAVRFNTCNHFWSEIMLIEPGISQKSLWILTVLEVATMPFLVKKSQTFCSD